MSSRFYHEVLICELNLADEEIVAGYTALIKALAVNLPGDLLKELLLKWNFSLYRAARMLLFYPDVMVSTASRSAFLRVLDLGSPQVTDYVLNSGVLGELLVTYREKLLELNVKVRQTRSVTELQKMLSEAVEFIYYLNDLFALQVTGLAEALQGLLLRQVLLPVVVGGLAAEHPQSFSLSLPVSCHLLSQFFYVLERSAVLSPLVKLLLSAQVEETLLSACYSVPEHSTESVSLLEGEKTVENPVHKVLFYTILQSGNNNWLCLALSLIQLILTNAYAIEEFSRKHTS